MDAVISGIHGNIEALDAVLGVIQELGATRIICLGDLVCYGPDTLECIRRSADWDVVIAGDWDLAMIDHDSEQWLPRINRHIEWVRGQIHAAPDSSTLLRTLQSYLPAFVEEGRHFTHGTPNDVREWVFPEDIYHVNKLNRIAEQFPHLCFCGHSHLQGLFRRNQEFQWDFILPSIDETYDLSAADKTLVTVGSVGQPRDGDPRAAFVTIEANVLRFHRVEYDVDVTVNKIRAIPEIDNMHGERLLDGR